MSGKFKVIFLIIAAFAWLIVFAILKEFLSPDGIFLVIMLSLITLFVITLIIWKRWQNEIEKSASDFREKHPPVSVTRLPVKRK